MIENITFQQFIYTYNFRYIGQKDYCETDKEDTCIIRVYLPSDDILKNDWFEFGINDFIDNKSVWKNCKRIFSKEILNSYVETISYNEQFQDSVTIYLTKDKYK